MALQQQASGQNLREILPFPEIDEFYNQLQARIHMVLEAPILEEPFTVFITALPRRSHQWIHRFENFPLDYAGVSMQRKLLEGAHLAKALDNHWDFLQPTTAGSQYTTDAVETISSLLFAEMKIGDLSLEDIFSRGTGRMLDYFGVLTEESKEVSRLKPNTRREAEYHIVNTHLDIATYWYLSVPLIQFAEFDGIVHIVHSDRDHLQFINQKNSDQNSTDTEINKKTVGHLITAFSRQLEDIILDWDLVGDNKEKRTALAGALRIADQDETYLGKGGKANPVLDELHYREYYEKHSDYFRTRFKLADEIPLNFRKQYHQIAILSILIDSYAHNISAHSLTALEWWFKQRAQLLEKRERSEEIFDGDFADIPLITSGQPLDNEIHPLLRFLLDKGAFWTGLTRAHNFGGKISSLYSVLWHDFVNNPLYLGTIAFSEDILKLNIHVTFLKRLSDEEGVRFKKRVELDGRFVSIDLSQLIGPGMPEEDMSKRKFIIPGQKFEDIRLKLKDCKVFFPGGVVGRHAFFTILENEIRNVKHFPPQELQHMKQDGLTLNISIEEDNYDESDKATYFKIGVWIKNRVELDKELFLKRLKNLWGDIITEETNRPKLGGIYQDKVCAAMLFNNSFSSVQDRDDRRGMRYYPWVKVGSSSNISFEEGDIVEDIEMTARRYFLSEFQKSKDLFENIYSKHIGYYKKYFHLWKGENIYRPSDPKNLSGDWENPSRFRFVFLPKEADSAFYECREAGIIRIIHGDTENLETAYSIWINKWMEGKSPEGQAYFKFSVKPIGKAQFQLSALLEWNSQGVRFYNNRTHKQLLNEKRNNSPVKRLNLIHGSENNPPKNEGVCRFRSHGILQQYFCEGKALRDVSLSPVAAAELFEVLATRICIFDNRLANRMEQANKEVVKSQLNCEIYSEDIEKWKDVQKQGFNQFHFLVVHLSFIEAFKGKDGKNKYSEDDIGAFIQEEVLKEAKADSNFFLVITTGRGRTQWWTKLKEQDILDEKEGREYFSGLPYGAFVTFRPVESLIAAVENSNGMKDDIELKYRLVKILFGS